MREFNDEPIEMPIDGTLDLHTFPPGEAKKLVPDYIEACLEKEIYQLRIIHGKGTGTLRRIVQSILDKHPAVASFRHETGSGGGWGATVVDLEKGARD
ncbi:MAG: Smr/MutS family protein [candidate division Zixibacteria bacterium]|nr:Smr/MutS family protein [candidate division Zixibacteria bacterium]